jgi:radical SAM superfamily enzyme YgiQ (UPF0313 family)
VPNKSILLISPPVTKPCEPPAGIAKLAGTLRTHGIDCRTWDAGIDCLLGLMDRPLDAIDTWTRRALTHRRENLDALRGPGLYRNRDRYRRAVMDINRVLHIGGQADQAAISLSNFTSAALSPARSADLLRAAERYQANPFFPVFSERVEALFEKRMPDVVGLSINFMSQAMCAFAMIGCIRERFPATKIVIGGGLVTSWTAIPGIGHPFAGLIDAMIGGPGEKRLLDMCLGKAANVPAITGYDYSESPMAGYLSPLRVLPYSASRGCYWKKCAFCPETAEDSTYLAGHARSIADELQQLTARTDAGLIHFLDNALSPRFMAHLIDRPPGAPWYGFARITAHLADPDFVRGLKSAGCVMLKLGVESGDQAVLDALHKGTTVDTTAAVLETLHRAGIATYVYLLFGTPAEDEAAARRTLSFTRRHAGHIDFLNLAIFNLPAHSREAGELDTVDFYAGDLTLYREFIHPRGWNRDRVRPFLSKRFKKDPAPPSSTMTRPISPPTTAICRTIGRSTMFFTYPP